jgi:hypothetical protein
MRKKRCYLILGKKSKYIYGAFPRTPEGKKAAIKYKDKLAKVEEKDNFFIIK